MEIEYEKTYLLKNIPSDLKNHPFKEYLDIYIPQKAEHPILRIRKRGNDHEMTKKMPISKEDRSKQHEFTIKLSSGEFLELESNIIGKRAKKLRYLYKYDDITAEIDVFQDDLKGLIIADFEFKSEEDMGKFTPPDFCLTEVTQEDFIAGGMLVGKNYGDIEPFLVKYNYKPLFID